MGGGSSKKMASMPATPAVEAPKPYEQEKEMDASAQTARQKQLEKARAALGQQGSIKTSPFGSQEERTERQKTLLGQ